MNKHRLITVLSAALIGLSAAASLPAAPDHPARIVAEAASGQNFNYGSFEFSHGPGSGQATLEKYTGSSQNVSIPGYVYDWNGNRLAVKKIGTCAFQNQNSFGQPSPMNITSVTIPNTVTEIGSWVFSNCPLTTVSLSENLTKIGDHSFYGTSLTSVVLPSGITEIGVSAFAECADLHAVMIDGPAVIQTNAFSNCTALYSLGLNSNCTLSDGDTACPFNDCTSLTYLNGAPVWYLTSDQKPLITDNSYTRALIRRIFWCAESVGFVDDYCDQLCQYVVDTETRPWMCEAVKARQLHDWLIDHCDYAHDSGYAVFLSFGMGEIGKGVCVDYARYYTMLLTKAGIESYILHAGPTQLGHQLWPDDNGHAWNLVKVDGKYYQVDVTWDDSNVPSYQHFLLSGSEMQLAHCLDHNINKPLLTSPTVQQTSGHPLLEYYSYSAGTAALNQCVYSFTDANTDGLLDGDWDFNNNVDYADYILSYYVDLYYNDPATMMSDWLRDAVYFDMEPWDFIRYKIAHY